MLWLISDAFAQDAAGAPGCDSSGIGLIVLILGVMYFLVIRPQNKARQEHGSMLATLKKGDEVVTDGGIVGIVHEVKEDEVTLEVAPKVRMRFKKDSVGGLVTKPEPAEEK
ncbi:MAG: preprotein translocase subunit YajC [Proteobacteria bacterium]|nr:preprotein translocase subunit YajC [Pseudomonadota bacterium]MCP4920148.1 preprotein translocase subunit YajC [Pseudomonadota bacterium]